MAFQKEPKPVRFADLKGVLSQSKNTDNALYQTIQQLIERLDDSGIVTTKKIAGVTDTVGNLVKNTASKFATYHTKQDDTPVLPNSVQLLAGERIVFDDSVANKRTINATPGASGSVFNYRIDTTSTGVSDPGAGKLRYNNATQNLATTLIVDSLTDDGFDPTLLFTLSNIGDKIIIQDRDIALSYQVWTKTGPATLLADFFTVPVSFDSSNGPQPFTNNQKVSVIIFTQTSGGGGGTPGGADRDLQFNNGGAFDGSSLKQLTADIIEQQNGVNTQEFRVYNTKAGADFERLVTRIGTDVFAEPSFNIEAEKGGTGSQRGIHLRAASPGNISFQIPGAFPAVILYHDPTANGGISLIPNASSFVGHIFCDQAGSFMETTGGFGVKHMLDLTIPQVDSYIIGSGAIGADFTTRYLTFDTVNLRLIIGRLGSSSGGGSGAGIGLVLDGASNNQIANLPVTPPKGTILTVTDALAPVIGNAVVAGGLAFAAVMWNGAQWTVFSV